jgi:tetraacyldisaccharide 4'-kinase
VLRGIVAPKTTDLCFAFCGIARPTNFFTELGKTGVRVVGTHAFRDHHAYTATDVELLFKLGQQAGATAFITTEKDAVNLDGFADRLHMLHVVPVRMEFESLPGGESPIEMVCAVLQRRAEMTVRE